MPESRLARTRSTLPEGYQYGDAGVLWWLDEDDVFAAMLDIALPALKASTRIERKLTIAQPWEV